MADTQARAQVGDQSLLLALEDGIRRIEDPRKAMAFAAECLAERLQADRVCYAEMDEAGDHFVLQVESSNSRLPPLAGDHRLGDLGKVVAEAMRGGEMLVCDDTLDTADPDGAHRRAFEATGIRAHVSIPLIRGGGFRAVLAVHQAEPRDWTPGEVALMREVGSRTWAAVARARMEGELSLSEARLRGLFESIDQGFCILDVAFDGEGKAHDYRFLEVNAAFERQTGLANAQGHSMREFAPQHETSWYEICGDVARSGRPRRFEKMASALGSRWYEVYAFPLEGEGHRVAMLFNDISDRKRTSDATRESQAQLAAILEHVPVGIGLFDMEGRYLLTNPRLQELVGDALPSRDPRSRWRAYDAEGNLLPPGDYPSSRALRGETVPPTVDFHIDLEGDERWVLFGAVPLWHEGAVVGGISVAQDITERRAVESALRESEWRLSTLIEGIPQLVWRSSGRGFWNWASPQWQSFTGQGQDQAIGQGWLAVIHPDDRELTRMAWDRAHDQQEEMAVEHRVLDAASGRHVWHSTRARPLRDKHGRIVEWLGTTTDIQQFKDLQGLQRDLLALLARQNQRKDEFLAILAHELRNPLAPLRTTLELLSEMGDERFARGLARMQRQVEHMVRLVDDLLEVSRMTRGTITLHRTAVDINDVLLTAIDTSRPWIDQAGHVFSAALHPQPCLIHADPVRLAQVFSNLLNNAAKFTRPPGRIELDSRQQGDWLRIEVRDDGMGLPPERIDDIFNLFTQIRQEKQQMLSGLGIGLTLVKNIVELHGGRVHASSAGLGQGSCFVVELPCGPPQDKTGGEQDMSSATGDTARPRHRVMVVDDNRDAADAIAEYLEFNGHDVAVAYDGEHALARFPGFLPELVLMDLGMPGLSGYETAQRMRVLDASPGLVLVALSGWTQEEDKRRSREAGFDVHLAKPVEVIALKRLIDERLGTA